MVAFGVDKNATITIASYSSHTHYTVTTNGVTSDEQTGTSYSVIATNGGVVIIKSTDANNYFYSITITYPSN